MSAHKQNPETPIMSDKSDNISDKSLPDTDRQALRADITARYENTLRSLDDAPKVEQCDRELVARVGRFDEEGRRQVLAGEWDHTTLVNVVVKFRIAAARAAALSDLAALDGETM